MMIRAFAALLMLLLVGNAAAEAPAERLRVLQRGINLTNWFRFPPSWDPAALRAYLDAAAMRDLRRAGFGFVRLPVQPDLLDVPLVVDALVDAIRRLQGNGLGVVVALHPADWHLEMEPRDRAKLAAFWHSLAPMLRRFDPAVTFPEVLNEPVFPGAADAWASLQHQTMADIRRLLPASTIVLTGADWGSVNGLLTLTPERDPNVIYSFHLYDPPELTALGAYRANLDTEAMARLPFPATDIAACGAIAESTGDSATAELMRFYCAQRWDVAMITSRIVAAAEWGRRHHVSVLAGEFGASDRLNKVARLTWLTAVRDACEQQAVGWALWGYDDSMGFAVRAPIGSRQLDSGVMRALGLVNPKSGK